MCQCGVRVRHSLYNLRRNQGRTSLRVDPASEGLKSAATLPQEVKVTIEELNSEGLYLLLNLIVMISTLGRLTPKLWGEYLL